MTENASYELVISRIFDAPRELVYRAFTDPDLLASWFGPTGWNLPRESVQIDVRPGGRQRFVLVSAEDPNVISTVDAEFAQVAENEFLVGTETAGHPPGAARPAGPLTLRLEFHDQGGHKTRLDIKQGPYTEEAEAQARQGWDSSFTKLDDLLAAS